MRVIAGSLRGRRLAAPRGRGTRPTPDRVREALFSALGSVEGLAVLDLYAGSGALAIEALSRGAVRAVAVERAAPALRALGQNLTDLELTDRCAVLALPVERSVRALAERGPFGLVLADPPYADLGAGRAIARVLGGAQVVAPAARLVVEHAARSEPPEIAGAQWLRTRRYGDTALSQYDLDSTG
ncbi:MAG: 16S rRNA (guanine(966)-N(2))-methyltransferase RsmD [Deltaproteobacteria bacterium]|nr:16S rRNA (guanine(966)-N(2))-methyltransferase RsmD [Deltaproteobacteria bacterium]